MDKKQMTVATDVEVAFDNYINTFYAKHKVISIDYCTTVVPYNGSLQPYFIAHITYLELEVK